MALFDLGELSPKQIITLAQARLMALRDALTAVDLLYQWLSAQSDADLTTGLGMSVDDLAAVRSAMADAHAFVALYGGAALPQGYTLPYPFGNSQRRVIGPS